MLAPGEDVVIADAKRPASGFDPFVMSMTKQIGAALEIPFELLMKSFTASYSASRASLLEAWKAFKMRRTWFANDFCQPVYELWLAEAVARGRINAPGFFNDPTIKKAWCGAEWIGPAQGMLDPVKEVNAAILRTEHGFSTHERETTELTGGNWDDNIAQITRENELLRKAKEITSTDNLEGGMK
jgi:lambda family phage portal protein